MTDFTALSSFFNSIPYPLLLLQQDGAVCYCNPAAQKLPKDEVPSFLSSISHLEGIASGTCTAGGREWRILASPGDGGILVLLTPLSSINVEQRSKPFTALTEQLRQQMGNLVAAAHLLTPLIQEQDDERYHQYFAIVNQSFYRMVRLLNNSEVLESLSDGTFPFQPVPVDLGMIFQELEDQVVSLAAAAEVTFRFERKGSPLLILGDRKLLEQMMTSLISNAIRAAGKGGKAEFRLAQAGEERAVVTVWDSGPDLDPGSSDWRGCRPGTLLGNELHIARRIAALHGGAIMLESRPGKGVWATASLPLCRSGQASGVFAPRKDYGGGFSPLLVELSDVLPYEVFLPESLE